MQVIIWDIPTAKKLKAFSTNSGAVHGLDFSADGQILATGYHNNAVCLWDMSQIYSGIVTETASTVQSSKKKKTKVEENTQKEDVVMKDADSGDKTKKPDGEGKTEGGGGDGEGDQQTQPSAPQQQANQADDPKAPGKSLLLHTAYTRHTPVFNVTFTYRNLLLASGPFVNPPQKKDEAAPRRW